MNTLETVAHSIDAGSTIAIRKQPLPPSKSQKKTARPPGDHGYSYRVLLKIRRSQAEDLQKIVDVFGLGGTISELRPAPAAVKRGKRGAASGGFEVVYTGEKAIKIINSVLPFLNTRREDAEFALRFWGEGSYWVTGMGSAPKEIWTARGRLYDEYQNMRPAWSMDRPKPQTGKRKLKEKIEFDLVPA